MSAANRGAERREGDHYPTPVPLCEAIVESLDFRFAPARILDPSCADGRFLFACGERWPTADLNGIEPNNPPPWAIQATLEEYHAALPEERFDLIIGNPPFGLAIPHIRICLEHLTEGSGRLVQLLRIGILETPKRHPFWVQHPPRRVRYLVSRPSFCWSYKCKICRYKWTELPEVETSGCPEHGTESLQVGKSDACTYAVFEWVEGYDGPTELTYLNWKD